MKTTEFCVSLILGLCLFMAATPVSAGDRIESQTVKQPAHTPEINVGKMNYIAYCSSCHGINAAGTDKGPPILHRIYHPGHHGDRAFFMAPKRGVRAHHWPFGDMPPVAGITDTQIARIIVYLRALQKANGIFE